MESLNPPAPRHRAMADVPTGSRLDATVDPPEPPVDDRLLLALTTEHAALQAARGSTIVEATGRATLYLAAVSSAVVAFAFIGQTSRIGQPFFLFTLAVLPALFFLGLVTYLRLLASAIEDMVCARAINRIRHSYLEFDPAAARYFLLSGHDDLAGVFANTGVVQLRWHLLSHTASLILVVNGGVGGVFAALVVDAARRPSVGVGAGLGTVVTVAFAALGRWHQRRHWHAAVEAVPVAFPSPASPAPGHAPTRSSRAVGERRRAAGALGLMEDSGPWRSTSRQERP